MKVTKGFALRITGNALTKMFREKSFDLPEDAFLFKVVPSYNATYCFDVLFTSAAGFEIAEGNHFPVVRDKEELPK